MADFYLDKGHFITARRAGPALFDEDDVCAGFRTSHAAVLNCHIRLIRISDKYMMHLQFHAFVLYFRMSLESICRVKRR